MNEKELLEQQLKTLNRLLDLNRLSEISKQTEKIDDVKTKEQQQTNKSELGRVCNKCGIFKPWVKFGNDSDGYMGKSARCKRCLNKYQVSYQKRKKEERKIEIPEKEPTVKVDSKEYPLTPIPNSIDERAADSVIDDKKRWGLFHK